VIRQSAVFIKQTADCIICKQIYITTFSIYFFKEILLLQQMFLSNKYFYCLNICCYETVMFFLNKQKPKVVMSICLKIIQSAVYFKKTAD
jgi:hypothetical protein